MGLDAQTAAFGTAPCSMLNELGTVSLASMPPTLENFVRELRRVAPDATKPLFPMYTALWLRFGKFSEVAVMFWMPVTARLPALASPLLAVLLLFL